jgi:PAS domain S-box-containing protein
MFRTTRSQIALIISIFCIIVISGFILLKISNQQKINFLVDEMKSEKAILLEKIVEFESKDLLTFTLDYTYWDDMVAFINNGDLKWARENIETSIPTYNIDFVWIYRPDLTLTYSTTRQGLEPVKSIPLTDDELIQISTLGRLQHFFIYANRELIEISMATIHPTADKERKTPVQGYFFSGRIWSNDFLTEIEALTQSNIRLINLQENKKSSENSTARKFTLLNTKELNNWNEQSIAKIESSTNIEIFQLLSSRFDQSFFWVAIVAFLLLIVFVTFFGIRVYKPLGLLSKSLETENPEFIRNLIRQKGEFGQFSVLINNYFIQKSELTEEINERKQVEIELRKLSTSIEQSPAIIMITGTDSKIEYVNPKFTATTGYTAEESIGRNPRFLKSGNKSKDDYKKLWDTITSGHEWQGEFSNKKKSGEIFFESAHISPIFDDAGVITNFLAIKEDITEKKRDETLQHILFDISKAASASNNLEHLIDKISIGLGELIDVTNFYLALYDEKTDLFHLPHYHDQKDEISSFSAEKTLTAYVLRNKKSFFGTRAEIDKLKKEGVVESIGTPAKIWLGVPLMIDNKALGVFVIQSYHNENAFSEKDKRMLEFISNEISHIIIRKKADEEVKVALEKAEDSDRLKSTFLANMSHEIRTPLNSILGFSELLGDPEIGPTNQAEFTQIIKSSGKHLLSIINDILDFSMIEAGQIRLSKSTFIIEKLVIDVYNEFFPTSIEKGIVFKFNPGIFKTETIIECDKTRLRQILSNLVNNALKFTRTGYIELGFSMSGDGFLFYIIDTGIGIPPEFKNYVFERFQQAEKSKSRNFGGNGLGLAISKNLVDMMGGKIWLESEVGKGSTFYVYLPG